MVGIPPFFLIVEVESFREILFENIDLVHLYVLFTLRLDINMALIVFSRPIQ